MAFTEEEKKALKKSIHWSKRLKKETLHSTLKHAYHKKRNQLKRGTHEDKLGLSEGQVDQQWIDKSQAILHKNIRTKVRKARGPP